MVPEKIDILNHVLVPEHYVLSEEEKKKLLEDYNISEIQLPSIKKTDPVVQLLKAKAGDVIKIVRMVGREKSTVYYRRVV